MIAIQISFNLTCLVNPEKLANSTQLEQSRDRHLASAARFQALIKQFSYLHQEKATLDAFILNRNREVEK